jgi:hypothetical protein
MSLKNRKLSVLMAVGYMLAVTFATFVHHHPGSGSAGCCGSCGLSSSDRHELSGSPHDNPRDGCPDSKAPVPRSADDKDCPVCQFLAQKPAPICIIAPVVSSTLVEKVATVDPTSPVEGIFSAWHSRAPPVAE